MSEELKACPTFEDKLEDWLGVALKHPYAPNSLPRSARLALYIDEPEACSSCHGVGEFADTTWCIKCWGVGHVG